MVLVEEKRQAPFIDEQAVREVEALRPANPPLYDDHQDADERSDGLNRQLSDGDTESERDHFMKVRSHAPI